MLPLSVGVFATPVQLAGGTSPPQRAGRGCAARSALVGDGAPLLPPVPGTHQEKNSNCEKSWEETP